MAKLFKRKGDPRWRVRYKRPDGRWTERVSSESRNQAERFVAEVLENESNPFAWHNRRALSLHIHDYVNELSVTGRTESHTREVERKLILLSCRCGWRTLSDVNASKAVSAAGELLHDGKSRAFVNKTLRVWKSFDRWLWRDGRIKERKLGRLETSQKPIGIRERRVLTAKQMRALIDTAECSTKRVRGVYGKERGAIYRLLLTAGLWPSELQVLRKEDYDLESNPPVVHVDARNSRTKTEATIPLAENTAKAIRPFVDIASPGAVVFAGSWGGGFSKMLRLDLEAASIPYRDASGRVVDAISLLYSMRVALSSSGASLFHTAAVSRVSHIGGVLRACRGRQAMCLAVDVNRILGEAAS